MIEARCEACFGRGYRGGGRLPICRPCGGRGTQEFRDERHLEQHRRRWQRIWKQRTKKAQRP